MGYDTLLEKIRYYKEMNDFTKKIVVPHFCQINKEDDEELQAIKKLAIIIIFEIIHESALTLEKSSILNDMIRPTGPQPYEYMQANEGHFEELRTPLGNIMSGAKEMFNSEKNGANIRYFLDPTSIGLLANVYGKINQLYYDFAGEVNETILDSKYRNKDFLIKTVKYMFTVLNSENIIDDNKIEELISDTVLSKEKSLLKAVSDEIKQDQTGTDPLKHLEAVEMIKFDFPNHKVISLFGFSDLGYSDYPKLFVKAREVLSQYSNAEYIVCIGATEDGVGKLYDIAKDMGFKTIGIVSTLALARSGKFSENVEKIYIVNDSYWGGYRPGTKILTETTKIFLDITEKFIAFGGGMNTKVTLEEAKIRNIPFEYFEFKMNTLSNVSNFDMKNGDKGIAYDIATK